MFRTIEDLTGLWETDAAFALAVGIDRKTIALFKHRQSIPSHAWTQIIEGAKREAKACRKAGDDDRAEKLERITAESLLRLQDTMRLARAS
jgi:hypothetical protein